MALARRRLPPVGTVVDGEIDWERRYTLMRTHTAMHAMCGVIWNRFQSPVTGGNMNPGEGRLDFEIPQWDAEDREPIRGGTQPPAQPGPADRGVFPRPRRSRSGSEPDQNESEPPASSLTEVRVIDIVGLDRQADGGTHVDSTGEVGPIRITKTESKGRGFRRLRFVLEG